MTLTEIINENIALQISVIGSLCFWTIVMNHKLALCVCVCVYMCTLSSVQFFVTRWAVATQAPLFIGFPM